MTFESGNCLNCAFISYCSPVQSRIVGASTSVYKFDSMIRGQDVYKSAWTLLTDKTQKCILREDNAGML